MPVMVRTAYLRVYEAIAAFSPTEQERWTSLRERDDAAEGPASRRWLLAASLPANELPLNPAEGAFVREIEGELFVCPWRTRLRMLAGLLAFRDSVPEEVVEAFVPVAAARRAAHELVELGERHPDVRSHMLHANWHVPLRWFAAFDPSDRILTEDRSGLRIRYETPMREARARLARALDILGTSWIDEEVNKAVRQLAAWLDQFSTEAWLELDYASVAGLFDPDDLVEDRSAAQVWACLEALEAGDVLRAGRVFGSVTERWSEVRARELAN